ncbi:MAG: alpha/beta hydrolase [Deltaproteobacteria bacterium HGW-Deltaproteobacteria-1]|jgi:pimeloyl-ACP methyl ester carboxylesterase|nr:MAG: alpha/beta hydrolase [Deltaproteobacteria bacterium HGW-Deltaproteobacteria-1]
MKIVKKVLIAIVVIIAALIAFYYAMPEKVAGYMMHAARSKAGLTKKEIKIDDHNIVYLEGGKGPTILLLHGYTGSKDNWVMLAPYLTKDYHVVIPDLPGYGESSMIEKDSYNLSNQMSRLRKFIQALELKKFHIAGNSMGGLFAGTYAVRYPDEIISVGLFDAVGVKSLEKSVVYKMAEKGENPLLLKDSNDMTRWAALLFVNQPSVPYPIEKVMVKTALANRQFYKKEGKEIFFDFYSLEKDLPKIKAPALILWGDKDQVIDISSVPVFEKGLKNHKTVIIKDCGHLPIMEKPKETAMQYIDFIKGIKN